MPRSPLPSSGALDKRPPSIPVGGSVQFATFWPPPTALVPGLVGFVGVPPPPPPWTAWTAEILASSSSCVALGTTTLSTLDVTAAISSAFDMPCVTVCRRARMPRSDPCNVWSRRSSHSPCLRHPAATDRRLPYQPHPNLLRVRDHGALGPWDAEPLGGWRAHLTVGRVPTGAHDREPQQWQHHAEHGRGRARRAAAGACACMAMVARAYY